MHFLEERLLLVLFSMFSKLGVFKGRAWYCWQFLHHGFSFGWVNAEIISKYFQSTQKIKTDDISAKLIFAWKKLVLQALGAIKVGFLQETEEYFLSCICTIHKMQLDLLLLKIIKSEKSIFHSCRIYCIFIDKGNFQIRNKFNIRGREKCRFTKMSCFRLCSFVLELKMNKEQKICVAFEAVTTYLYILIFRKDQKLKILKFIT